MNRWTSLGNNCWIILSLFFYSNCSRNNYDFCIFPHSLTLFSTCSPSVLCVKTFSAFRFKVGKHIVEKVIEMDELEIIIGDFASTFKEVNIYGSMQVLYFAGFAKFWTPPP